MAPKLEGEIGGEVGGVDPVEIAAKKKVAMKKHPSYASLRQQWAQRQSNVIGLRESANTEHEKLVKQTADLIAGGATVAASLAGVIDQEERHAAAVKAYTNALSAMEAEFDAQAEPLADRFCEVILHSAV